MLPKKVSENREEMRLDEADGANKASRELDARSDDVYESDSPSEGSSDRARKAARPRSSTGPRPGRASRSRKTSISNRSPPKKSPCAIISTTSSQIAGLNDADRLIASRLIEETDEAGFMRGDVQRDRNRARHRGRGCRSGAADLPGFEPTGVMARNLQECLSLQLIERDRFDPAMQKLMENLEIAARRDFQRLAELCGVDQEDVIDMLAELRTLTPRPGAAFAGEAAPAITPDVFVREMPNGTFSVELNADTLPRVLLDRTYYAEVSRPLAHRRRQDLHLRMPGHRPTG